MLHPVPIALSKSDPHKIYEAHKKSNVFSETFLSIGCAKYGFGDAEYTTKEDGDRVFFTADIYSEKYGKPEQVKWWKGNEKK